MGPLHIKVTQPVSLSTVYGTEQPQGQPRLADRNVTQSKDGLARAKNQETKKSSTSPPLHRRLANFKFTNTQRQDFIQDFNASVKAQKFNELHTGFSSSIKALLGEMSGEKATLEKDQLGSLHQNAADLSEAQPWASAEQILDARLDMEMSQLSNEQLDNISNLIQSAETSSLTEQERSVLDAVQHAVARHTLARSENVSNLLTALADDAGSKDFCEKIRTILTRPDSSTLLTTQLDNAVGECPKENKLIQDLLASKQLTGLDEGQKLKVVREAVTLALGSGHFDSEKIGVMNRNLLNISSSVTNVKGVSGPLQNKLAWSVIHAVRQCYLQTKVHTFEDSRLTSRMKVLGSGMANQVSTGNYELPSSKGQVTKVHKPDIEVMSGKTIHIMGWLRIERSDPRMTERSLFTSRYDEHLKFYVSVRSEIAIHRDKIGIVMDLAQGTTAKSFKGSHGLSNGAIVQRELIKLQLLDTLTGQGDRHTDNYMISKGIDGSINGIYAIDNDFCMGLLHGDTETFVGKRSGYHLPHLPPVVDSDMMAVIMAIKDEDITKMADNMFGDAAIESAKHRLHLLKDHLTQLRANGQVIAPAEWGTEKATTLLNQQASDNNPNSYWQRDKRLLDGGGDNT